jgi:catechol 2,3-dioxygenase-like lactoylglutathione lyase family enzyme
MPTTTGVRFRANTDVAVHVPDLAAAEAFYGGVLGFAVTERGPTHLAFDTGSFKLWVNRDDEARPFIPSLDTPDTSAARVALTDAGCRIVRNADGTGGFYFEDPFGFVIDVIERA